MEHLTTEQIQRYTDRSLAPDERVLVSEHIVGCEQCRLSLLEARRMQPADVKNVVLSVGTVEQDEDVHLSYDEIVSYVEGPLEPMIASAIGAHLDSCDLCRHEVDEIRGYRAMVSAGSNAPAAAERKPPWQERLRSFVPRPRLRTSLQFSSAALAGAGALLALLQILPGLKQRLLMPPTDGNLATRLQQAESKARRLQAELDRQNQQVLTYQKAAQAEATEKKVLVQARQQLISVQEERNQWRAKAKALARELDKPRSSPLLAHSPSGIPSIPVDPEDSQALRDHYVNLPIRQLALLKTDQHTMGPAGETDLMLISPINDFVTSLRPTLRWMSWPQAKTYEVRIVDVSSNETAVRKTVNAPTAPSAEVSWQIPNGSSLVPARVYRWYVKALSADKTEAAHSPDNFEIRFRTLTSQELQEVARKSSLYAKHPLLLGILFARLGALEEAEQVLTHYVGTHAGEAGAEQILKQVRQAIEKQKP